MGPERGECLASRPPAWHEAAKQLNGGEVFVAEEKNPVPPHYPANAVHLMRTTQLAQLQLSAMADTKANIVMGATFVIFTITIGQAHGSAWPSQELAEIEHQQSGERSLSLRQAGRWGHRFGHEEIASVTRDVAPV